jgi:hypothetical protein
MYHRYALIERESTNDIEKLWMAGEKALEEDIV